MFEVIRESYSSASETYIQLLIEKYNSCKIKECENVTEHINKMIVSAKELAAA